jgi:hypothetical protein
LLAYSKAKLKGNGDKTATVLDHLKEEMHQSKFFAGSIGVAQYFPRN